MTDLAARIELDKLAEALRVPDGRLDFLGATGADEIRTIRQLIATAIAERNAPRLHRVAGLTGKVPTALAAKIARSAFGARLSAGIAGSIPPADAAKLAGALPAGFLAEVAVALNPERVEGVITSLPDPLLVEVGREILAAGEHAALGRLVAVVSTEVALQVVAEASAEELLRIALYADAPERLEPVIDGLTDERLLGVHAAAGAFDPEAQDLLLSRVSARTRDRLAALIG